MPKHSRKQTESTHKENSSDTNPHSFDVIPNITLIKDNIDSFMCRSDNLPKSPLDTKLKQIKVLSALKYLLSLNESCLSPAALKDIFSV